MNLSIYQVNGSPQNRAGTNEEYQPKEKMAWILKADTSMAPDAINLIEKREAVSSTEKISDLGLQIENNSVNEIEDTINNKGTVSSVSNKGDLAIPYDTLGWFSKAVEAAMDGSLYIGLAIGIMFISASVLTGAIEVFGETCLICAFIGYANTVSP